MSKPLFIRNEGVLLRLLPEDIYCMEAEKNHTILYFTNHTGIKIRCPLETAVSLLPDKQFAQVHRSFGIAIEFLARIERDHVVLWVEEMIPYLEKGKEPNFIFPLSKGYVKGLMECLTVVVRKSRSRWGNGDE